MGADGELELGFEPEDVIISRGMSFIEEIKQLSRKTSTSS